MKTCFTCKQLKDESEFHNDKNRPNGKYPNCKTCRKTETNKYKIKHKEEILAYQKEYRKNHPEYTLWIAAKNRSKKMGLDFNLKLEDIKIPSHCPVLGIPIIVKVGIGKYDNAPSLDRIHGEKGYVRGNVLIVSWRANDVRGNATSKELQKVSEFYQRYEQ